MRISDWSSDVCSSDLVLEFQRFGRIADRSESLKDSMGVINNRVIDTLLPMNMGYFPSRPIRHGKPEDRLTMSRGQLLDITNEKHSTRWLAGCPDQENGRASCREHVCQRGDLGGH